METIPCSHSSGTNQSTAGVLVSGGQTRQVVVVIVIFAKFRIRLQYCVSDQLLANAWSAFRNVLGPRPPLAQMIVVFTVVVAVVFALAVVVVVVVVRFVVFVAVVVVVVICWLFFYLLLL
ncbi:unnamed protein product [Polarella glacialis]|uniref:Uncharacterized protein n=1 Tax=Polarella glacialis TaxID=89957 RepID=A0A813GRB9_POLGL|nr:unnamed protein product [Polarella glacialis]